MLFDDFCDFHNACFHYPEVGHVAFRPGLDAFHEFFHDVFLSDFRTSFFADAKIGLIACDIQDLPTHDVVMLRRFEGYATRNN